MDQLTLLVKIAMCIVVISMFTMECAADPCPSPPVVYASRGDNVTLCWKLLPAANDSDLSRFTVMTLYRPVEAEMKKVASANDNGAFLRTYTEHDGLYVGRVALEADLQAGNLFFRISNYTSQMDNVYCVLYEMSVSDNVQTCHSQAVLLRNTGNEYITNTPSTAYSTMVNVAAPKEPPTKGERAATQHNFKVPLIVVSSLLAVSTFLTVVAFVLYYRVRNK